MCRPTGVLVFVFVAFAVTTARADTLAPSAPTHDALPDGAVARLGTARLKHPPFVSALAYAPDGRTIVTSAGNSPVRVWDAATGRLVGTIGDQSGGVFAFAYTPDGTGLACASWSGVKVYDVITGRVRADLFADKTRAGSHAIVPKSLTFSRDGRFLAGASSMESVAWVWEVATGKLAQRVDVGRPATVVALSPDGRVLAARGGKGEARLVEVASGQDRGRLATKGFVTSLAFLPDRRTVLVGQAGAPNLAWDTETGKTVREFGHSPGSNAWLALTPDGAIVAVLFGRERLVLFDAATGAQRQSLPLPDGMKDVKYFDLSPDARTIAMAGAHGPAIHLIDTATGRPRPLASDGHAGPVFAVGVTADGSTISSVGSDGTIAWDAATGRVVRRTEIPDFPAKAAAVAPDGRGWMAIGQSVTNQPSAALFVGDTGQAGPPRRIAAVPFATQGLVLAPDGRSAAVAEFRAVVVRRAAPGGEAVRIPNERGASVRCMTFAPDGKTLVISGGMGAGQWDTANGQQVRTFPAPVATDAVAFTPDGKTLAVAALDGSVRLWDIASGGGEPRLLVRGPRRSYESLLFLAQGRALAAGASDGEVRVWEVASGREVATFSDGHGGTVRALAVTPDGRRLVSAGADGVVMIWDLARLGPLADVPPSTVPLQALWADLAGSDAARAFRAVQALAAAPDVAVPFLRERLVAASPPDEATVARLLARLGGDSAADRDRAAADLAKFGPAVEPYLRRSLQGVLTPDARAAVERILKNLPHPKSAAPAGDDLRHVRAIEALERMATPAARSLLSDLASGPPDAKLTQEAKAALERLRMR